MNNGLCLTRGHQRLNPSNGRSKNLFWCKIMAAYLWEGYKDITCSQQRFVESSSLAGCIHFAAERSTLSHSGIQMFHDRWRMEAILRPLTISFYLSINPPYAPQGSTHNPPKHRITNSNSDTFNWSVPAAGNGVATQANDGAKEQIGQI